ncbi:MAG: peptidoglycan DD-metalloendopeptidase family protein [Bacteroidota bacterium]
MIHHYVIVEHEGGEFPYYLHLQQNSIQVKEEELIERGHQTGKVGHIGNSKASHLHFHLVDKPDPETSSCLPIYSENIESWPDDAHADAFQYRDIITAKEK